MIQELEKIDKSFSEGTFLTKVDHIFIMILNFICSCTFTLPNLFEIEIHVAIYIIYF